MVCKGFEINMTPKFEVSSKSTEVAHFLIIKNNSSYEEKKNIQQKKIEEKRFIFI